MPASTEAAAEPSKQVDELPADLPTRTEHAGTQARAQSAEYGGIWDSTPLTLDDGTVIHVPPDPRHRLLDDDQMEAYDTLLFEAESYDRGDDIVVPEQKVYDGNGNVVTTLEPQTRPGPLLVPYRKTDANGNTALISPSWEVRVVKAALGDDDYAKLRAGTVDGERGSARHIQQIWTEHNAKIRERQAADSKSAGGAVDMATVPAADSSGTEAAGDPA